jgi:MFS family permease
MVYPTLLAVIGDASAPAERATSVGVYRLWRDSGYAAGGVFAGLVADLAGYPAAILSIALLTAISGLGVLLRMREAGHFGVEPAPNATG